MREYTEKRANQRKEKPRSRRVASFVRARFFERAFRKRQSLLKRSPREFLVNCPRENWRRDETHIREVRAIPFSFTRKEKKKPTNDNKKETEGTRTSMSFNLSSSLTLNREYPAGVSNKSSIREGGLLLLGKKVKRTLSRGEEERKKY